MTPEEIQAQAAQVQANNYAPPVSIAAPSPVDPAAAQNSVPSNAQVPVQGPAQDPAQMPVDNSRQVVPGQRVQAVDAFHVAPLAIGARDIANRADAIAETSGQDLKTAHDNSTQAINEKAQVDRDIADAQAPIEEDRRDVLAAQAEDEQAIRAQADADAEKHFKLIQTYNQEIQDHVANQPTDLWGRAGVNKVAGIIGLVLGGLGGAATGGKNLVVDTLNTLVDQNLKQNEYKYEMLKGKVSGENQAYAQIRATSQDKQQAADRFRLISLEQYKQQMEQAAKQFAAPEAAARAHAAIAQIDMQTAELRNKQMEQTQASYQHAATIDVARRQQDLSSIQLQAEAQAAGRKAQDEQSVSYWEPTDKSHMTAGDATKLREQQGGAAQVQDILGAMISDAQNGGIDGIINNTQGRANLQIALIQQKNLSKRVTEAEAKAMEGMTGFLASGNVANFLTAMHSSTVPEALFKAKQQFAKQHVTNLAVGYGLKPTEDNPFVRAANASYGVDMDQGQPITAVNSADPLASMPSRTQIAQQAAIDARKRMQPQQGYGAM